jgi:3-keto-disaccharide hydrolase
MKTPYVAAGLLLGAAALAASQSWNFDKDPTGKIAPGWMNASGTWWVVADATAPSKGNVLAQVSREHSGSYFNVAVADKPALTDVSISVRYRSVSGQEDQGGGPVWRYRDLKNYYIARENPLEGNYRVYKVVNGRRIQLGSADVKAPPGKWHEFKVTMAGDHIQCFLDGKKHLDVKDDTFNGPGKVGLWTKADAQTHFDNFSVDGK